MSRDTGFRGRGGPAQLERLGEEVLAVRAATESGQDRRPAAMIRSSIPAHNSEGGHPMPTYMDMHDIPGVKADDVAGAHEADLRVQDKYGVNYKQYWVDENEGKVFCLVDAPDKESAARTHREAHGLEAQTLYEVKEGA